MTIKVYRQKEQKTNNYIKPHSQLVMFQKTTVGWLSLGPERTLLAVHKLAIHLFKNHFQTRRNDFF
jgi:hypothetical protein